MVGAIAIAVINGVVVGLNRVMNSALSRSIGAFQASAWNHMVGFLLLISVILLREERVMIQSLLDVPFYQFFGGFVGALFVAINGFVLWRIGTLRTTIIIMSGEMVMGSWIDYLNGEIKNPEFLALGIMLILFGASLSFLRSALHVKLKGARNA